jgi:prophage maintenance system killer protein
MATKKQGGGIVAILLLLLLFKRKKNNIVIEPTQPAPNIGADYLVQIRKDGKFYDMNKTTISKIANEVLKVDGYKTNELPSWLKIKFANNFYYVKQGDFKIL